MTEHKPISVLLVEDCATARALLTEIICGDSRLHLAGQAVSGEEALQQIEKVSPDIISLDIELPGIDGVEVTRRIMATKPTPIVIVSAHTAGESERAIQALEAGALSIIDKPSLTSQKSYAELRHSLVDILINFSELKLVRRRFNSEMRVVPEALPLAMPHRKADKIKPGAVGIVASTGGPGALADIVSQLPPDFPLPICIVQHMGDQFIQGFADWLAHMCALHVGLARTGELLVSGRIYIAPGGTHMSVADGRVHLDNSERVGGHRPAGNVLLSSMAKNLKHEAIGLVLTGMGEDGARGLQEMREAGAYTIAQNEETSVVYGMPAAAARLDAACEILPLESIAAALINNSDRSNKDYRSTAYRLETRPSV